MSSTRAAIHKLAAFLRSSSSEEATGHTEAAEGLVDEFTPHTPSIAPQAFRRG